MLNKKINPRNIQKNYIEAMEDELRKDGVIFFEPEKNLNINYDFLQLPPNITEVHSSYLGECLNAFIQQKLYLRTLLSRCELLVEEKKRKYNNNYEKYYTQYAKDKLSETAKEKIINALSDVKPSFLEYSDSLRKKTLVQYSIENIEDTVFMISREITRRLHDVTEESRGHNIR